MIKTLSFLFLFLGISAQSQIVNIPDAIFKNTLVNSNCVDTDNILGPDSDADLNNDGEIQVSEAEAVLRLYVFGLNISSLEGIESFTNIEFLNCHSNQLTNLDITQNSNLIELLCYNNSLENNLDVSQNPNLEILNCSYNQITSLDVSQNQNLQSLGCGYNTLISLDVTQNSNLATLNCPSNQLTHLDVSQNPNLDRLFCALNQITNLDVSQNPNLYTLFCEHNQLVSLELNNPVLNNFICSYNQLTSLDVSESTNLVRLSCEFNQITTLDLRQNPNLNSVTSFDNQLTTLDIRSGNNTVLTRMGSYNNPNLFCISVDDVNLVPECNLAQTNGWCKDDWAIYGEDCTLNNEEFEKAAISLYPNPAHTILNIQSNNELESVKVYSINGNLLKEPLNTSIDISNLKNGMYFLYATFNKQIIISKFIKK